MTNPNNDTDLELLRNNFASIEFFNLEQRLKLFLKNSISELEEINKRVNILQARVPARTFERKEYVIKTLIKFDAYTSDLVLIQKDLFEYIEKNYTLPAPTEIKKVKSIPKTPKAKQKRRVPKQIPKPKKPRDKTEQ